MENKSLSQIVLVGVVSSLVVICQVGAATATQSVETTYGFNQPYFLNYLGTSCLIVCFLFQFLYYILERLHNSRKLHSEDSKLLRHSLEDTFEKGWVSGYFYYMENATQMSWKKLLLCSCPLSILWFFANYFFAIALSMTNIASSMSLEQATTIFVFILSVIILKEPLRIFKVLSVGICIIGVITVAIGDQLEVDTDESDGDLSEAFLGDLLVLSSAVCSSLYMITYKKLLDNLPIAIPAVNTLLGLIGCWNIILFWPGLIILTSLGVEEYSGFHGTVVYIALTSFVLALSFNYCLNYGMILTSPLFMRVIIICGVPASFIVNVIIYGLPEKGWPVVLRVLGAFLIIVGFIWFTFGSSREAMKAQKTESTEEESI